MKGEILFHWLQFYTKQVNLRLLILIFEVPIESKSTTKKLNYYYLQNTFNISNRQFFVSVHGKNSISDSEFDTRK